MVSNDYIFALEKRICILEEKISKREDPWGLSVDELLKKIIDAGPEGLPPSIIKRQKNGYKVLNLLEEKKEISMIIEHRDTPGKPKKRLVHNSFLQKNIL